MISILIGLGAGLLFLVLVVYLGARARLHIEARVERRALGGLLRIQRLRQQTVWQLREEGRRALRGGGYSPHVEEYPGELSPSDDPDREASV